MIPALTIQPTLGHTIQPCHARYHRLRCLFKHLICTSWYLNGKLSPHRPLRNPLFYVDLVMDHQGVHYSTNLNTFEASVISLFDKGLQSCQHVPQLEKVNRIFTDLHKYSKIRATFTIQNRIKLTPVANSLHAIVNDERTTSSSVADYGMWLSR